MMKIKVYDLAEIPAPRRRSGAGDLQPGHAELGVALDLEQLVREGDDLVPMGHGPRLYGRLTKIGRCSA